MSNTYLGITPDFHPDTGELSQPFSQPYSVDAELQSLLQALPTKADIAALFGTVEATHRKELNAVKSDVKALTTRIRTGVRRVGLGTPVIDSRRTPENAHAGPDRSAAPSRGHGGPEPHSCGSENYRKPRALKT